MVACACEAVAIPMKNTRLTINHDVFSAEILTFTTPANNRYVSVATCFETPLLQVLTEKIIRVSTRSFLLQQNWFNHPTVRGSGNRRDHSAFHLLPASIALDSRRLAGFRRRLTGDAWLFPSLCRGLSRFGRGFYHRRQFSLGLFCSAMMAVVQRLDARGFIFRPQLSVAIFLALIFKILWNCFRCHSQIVAEPATSDLSNFALSQRSARFRRWRVSGNTLSSCLRTCEQG